MMSPCLRFRMRPRSLPNRLILTLKLSLARSEMTNSRKANSLFQTFGHNENQINKGSSATSPHAGQVGKVFNTVTPSFHKEAHKPIVEEKKTETGKQTAPPIEDNDDWSAVPAFLRRSKLK